MHHHLEAEYETGYIHSNQYNDVSPYALNEHGELGPNIFNDILHKRPEQIHGGLKELRLVTTGKTYTIDWVGLPDNARPIYTRDVEQDFIGFQPSSPQRVKSIKFGYQYTDKDGKNVKEIQEF